jgi:hypothetical protein
LNNFFIDIPGSKITPAGSAAVPSVDQVSLRLCLVNLAGLRALHGHGNLDASIRCRGPGRRVHYL